MRALAMALAAAAAIALPARAVELYPAAWTPVPVQTWGGLDVLRDTTDIDPADSPDAKNVITDSGYLEKRPGNVRIAQVLNGYAVRMVQEWVAPSRTRYLLAHSSTSILYTDLGGSAVVLSSVTASQNVEALPAFGKVLFADGSQPAWYWDGTSTGSIAGMPICNHITFAHERIYCGNIPSESSSRVRVSSYGGVGYWTVPSNVSQVADAPNVFDFQKDDGEGINCLKATPWGVFVGKRHSTHILKGYDNLTYYKRVIDPNVGCLDQRTVQIVGGQIIWLALDGIYTYNGTGQPQLLTRNIEPLISDIRQLNSQAAEWIINVQADWRAGLASDSGSSWDSNISPGNIVMSSRTLLHVSSADFAGATFTNLSSWTTTNYYPLSFSTMTSYHIALSSPNAWCSTRPCNANVVLPEGDLTSTNSWTNLGRGSYCGGELRAAQDCATFAPECALDAKGIPTAVPVCASGGCGPVFDVYSAYSGTKLQTILTDYSSRAGSWVRDECFALNSTAQSTSPLKVQIYFDGQSQVANTPVWGTGSYICWDIYWNQSWNGSGPCSDNYSRAFIDNIRISSYPPTGQVISAAIDTTFSSPTLSAFLPQFSSAAFGTGLTFQEQDSADGASWSTAQSLSVGATPAAKRRHWRWIGNFTTTTGTTTAVMFSSAMAQFDSTTTAAMVQELAVATGTWDSPWHYVGDGITSWKQLNVTETNDGTIRYFMRSTDTVVAQGNTTQPWTEVTNNINISIATGTYVQLRVDSSSVTYATHAVTNLISRAAINWQEGEQVPMASGYLDRRYYLCAEFSTSAVTNDGCLVLQKNGKWMKWTGPAIGGMGLFDNNLVMADASTMSYVWKVMQPGVLSDDGSPIDAYWTTKDFTAGLGFNNKVLREVWLDAAPHATSSMTVSHAVNQSSTFTDHVISLSESNEQVNKVVMPTGDFPIGKTVKLKFSNDSTDQYMRLNNYLLYLEPQGRQLP